MSPTNDRFLRQRALEEACELHRSWSEWSQKDDNVIETAKKFYEFLSNSEGETE